MSKIILIFIENDDFEKEIDKRYLKKLKILFIEKSKKDMKLEFFQIKI